MYLILLYDHSRIGIVIPNPGILDVFSQSRIPRLAISPNSEILGLKKNCIFQLKPAYIP